MGSPGSYTVRLSAEGKTWAKPLTVRMDPRVKTSQAGLNEQFALSQRLANDAAEVSKAVANAGELEKKIRERRGADIAAALVKSQSILGPPPEGFGSPVTPVNTDHTSLRYLAGALSQLYGAVQSADVAPTAEQQKAAQQLETQMKATLAEWQTFASTADR